jgi:cardiolipin synthase A/B
MLVTKMKRLSSEELTSIHIRWSRPVIEERATNHDVFLELAGPSAVDVHHNFVQRWNEASERFVEDGSWGTGSKANLQFPTRVPAERGSAVVQIQRTIPKGRYFDRQATPEGVSFDIASGEQSNFDQYCAAINAARRSIHIENQYVDVPEILDCLRRALGQGTILTYGDTGQRLELCQQFAAFF